MYNILIKNNETGSWNFAIHGNINDPTISKYDTKEKVLNEVSKLLKFYGTSDIKIITEIEFNIDVK
jgi:hypothetical protein